MFAYIVIMGISVLIYIIVLFVFYVSTYLLFKSFISHLYLICFLYLFPVVEVLAHVFIGLVILLIFTHSLRLQIDISKINTTVISSAD